MPKLFAPNGFEIIGTVEIIPDCVCDIKEGTITRKQDGTYDFQYVGGTDVNWDGQKTATNQNGERLFWDEDYNKWPESVLVLREEENEDA
jgi:hypothetical protein